MEQKEESIKLSVLSPESTILKADVSMVGLPGVKGRFTVLKNHQPLISALNEGQITYLSGGVLSAVDIKSGFVEVNGNAVTVCVEI